jgi:hypothetical protein
VNATQGGVLTEKNASSGVARATAEKFACFWRFAGAESKLVVITGGNRPR